MPPIAAPPPKLGDATTDLDRPSEEAVVPHLGAPQRRFRRSRGVDLGNI